MLHVKKSSELSGALRWTKMATLLQQHQKEDLPISATAELAIHRLSAVEPTPTMHRVL